MRLPVIPVPNRQDFPDAPGWISKLLYPIQLFMTTVVNALTNQLNFQDNVSCVINSTSFTASSTGSNNTYTFQCDLGRQPVALMFRCTRTDGVYEVVYPLVSWNFINNQVVINGISGLTNTKQYTFTFTVI